MNGARLALRYGLFALIATLANLGLQRLVLLAGDAAVTVALALLAGTAVGLVVKYLLDRRWIFGVTGNEIGGETGGGLRRHGRSFSLYSLTGVVTTAIFWGTELGFWYLGGTALMRELGAVVGLSLGYVVKYRLDRRFVFGTPGRSAAA